MFTQPNMQGQNFSRHIGLHLNYVGTCNQLHPHSKNFGIILFNRVDYTSLKRHLSTWLHTSATKMNITMKLMCCAEMNNFIKRLQYNNLFDYL